MIINRIFKKKLECSCIIIAITCKIERNKNDIIYHLGGHNHYKICEKCKEKQENQEDNLLYDIWQHDNITNEFGYNDWIEISK